MTAQGQEQYVVIMGRHTAVSVRHLLTEPQWTILDLVLHLDKYQVKIINKNKTIYIICKDCILISYCRSALFASVFISYPTLKVKE